MISIQNFSFRFRDSERYALRDVTLDVAEGDFVVLAGPSGCGKSTLALALGGFLFNQYDGEAEGEIHVGGLDARRALVYDVAELVGLVQQNPEAQFCTLTVQDEVAFGLENRCLPRAEIRERMAWALDIVGARHLQERPLASLSGGEKQRVAVASVMAARPRVLIFDEPTSNLDPPATAQLFDVIARIRAEERITVIVIEHKTAYLERFNPRWLWLEAGRLTEANGRKSADLADSADLTSNPLNPFNPLRQLNGNTPLLKVSGLSAGYNGKAVLHDVSVEIGPGEFVAVMGDNGSGKTTFLQCLLGLLRPMQGTASILGQDTQKTPVSRLARAAAYVFQNPDHQLFAESVWQEATLAPRNFGVWNDDTARLAESLLATAGLGDRHADHPYRLSYGEKRRLTLAAVLTYAPRLILLDEVLIGQDPRNAAHLLGWLAEQARAGSAVVLVNHAPEVARRYASRLLFFDAGRLLVDAPIAAGFASLAEMGRTAYVEALPQESPQQR
ncbi:MAG TPA: ATP-binding cassette domain-containing protein [Anaerolineae bacterium]|nr:ATP-binding cassette domain-containing protein [Anaerolineae bacterium]